MGVWYLLKMLALMLALTIAVVPPLTGDDEPSRPIAEQLAETALVAAAGSAGWLAGAVLGVATGAAGTAAAVLAGLLWVQGIAAGGDGSIGILLVAVFALAFVLVASPIVVFPIVLALTANCGGCAAVSTASLFLTRGRWRSIRAALLAGAIPFAVGAATVAIPLALLLFAWGNRWPERSPLHLAAYNVTAVACLLAPASTIMTSMCAGCLFYPLVYGGVRILCGPCDADARLFYQLTLLENALRPRNTVDD